MRIMRQIYQTQNEFNGQNPGPSCSNPVSGVGKNNTVSKTAEIEFIPKHSCTANKREDIFHTHTHAHNFSYGKPLQHYTNQTKANIVVYNVSVFNVFRGQTTTV